MFKWFQKVLMLLTSIDARLERLEATIDIHEGFGFKKPYIRTREER